MLIIPFEYYGYFKGRKKHVNNTNAKLAGLNYSPNIYTFDFLFISFCYMSI